MDGIVVNPEGKRKKQKQMFKFKKIGVAERS
jgi:hypothetical protein